MYRDFDLFTPANGAAGRLVTVIPLLYAYPNKEIAAILC